MNSKERFSATLMHQPVDRLPCWLGMPMPEVLPVLLDYFKVGNISELKVLLDDDLFPVDVPYCHPPANHIACAFDFSINNSADYKERTLTGHGFFSGKTDPQCIPDFPWPNPEKHIDIEDCRRAATSVPVGKVGLGMMWSAHFQDACAAFGMENALMTMIAEPEMFKAVIERILDFYLQANEIFYHATAGKLQAVLLGNDFGSQNGLLLSPEMLRQLVFPGIKRLILQAHRHNLKVIYHSCGSIEPIIGDLIDAGADIIHPIQPLAVGMDAESLKRRFGGRVTFCGGVDVQQLMTKGTPQQIKDEVARLKRIFPTGLIISPSHEAIMADVPPLNIAAMIEACAGRGNSKFTERQHIKER